MDQCVSTEFRHQLTILITMDDYCNELNGFSLGIWVCNGLLISSDNSQTELNNAYDCFSHESFMLLRVNLEDFSQRFEKI